MKIYNPTSPGRRGMTGIDFRSILTPFAKPKKRLTKGFSRAVGRNNLGRITTRHKGGGVKRRYRELSFEYDKKDISARVVSIEYDPNRTGFIALLVYQDGEYQYRLSPAGLHVGDEVLMSVKVSPKIGNASRVGSLTPGTEVYNIELKPGSGGKLVRGAGDTAEILSHQEGFTLVKLPSGETRRILSDSWASIGVVSHGEHRFITYGKAGRKRAMGIRPTVRGSAMNPVDHPYGGGEGRAPQGTRRPKNKWGKGVRGVKTRRRKKYSDQYIIERRKRRK